jgi:LmbE family N-acetylglucosaminyl deacetylase
MVTDPRSQRYLDSLRIDPERTEMLKTSRRILAFSPHPDDTEIVAGGYLASAVDRGAKVKVVVTSDDRMSFTSMETPMGMEEIAAVRKKEETEAMHILGIDDLEFLEYIDSQVPEPKVLLRDYIRIIRNYEPDLAITVDPYLPYEAHPDHVNTGKSVMQAVLFHNYPYIMREFEVKSKPPLLALAATVSPNAIVPIDDSIDRKLDSILAHASQFPDREKMSDFIRTMSALHGKFVGCAYGEAFRVLVQDELHLSLFASF